MQKAVLLFFIAYAWSTSIHAASVIIGPHTVELDIPKGYCELSKADPSDVRLIRYLEDSNKNVNQLISLFADCEQLISWRSGTLDSLNDYGYILTPVSSINQKFNLTTELFVAEMLKVFEKQGARFLDKGIDTAVQSIEKHFPTAKLNETKNLGIIGTDNKALYWALTQNLKTELGKNKNIAGVMAMTLAGGKSVNLYLWRTYEGGRTIRDLEAYTSIWVHRTFEKN